jgi:hypothetical protein
MAASKRPFRIADDEQGQSLLEFLFMLPMMIGLIVLMTRVNTAIQASIVDQQYARAQTTWLTFNSPVYPNLRLQASELNGKNYNQMMIGVSDNLIGGSELHPEAQTTFIPRKRSLASRASDDPQVEPESRANVRIRNTVSLCTQPNVLNGQPVLPLSLDASGPHVVGPYNFPETAKFDYCRSLIQ